MGRHAWDLPEKNASLLPPERLQQWNYSGKKEGKSEIEMREMEGLGSLAGEGRGEKLEGRKGRVSGIVLFIFQKFMSKI